MHTFHKITYQIQLVFKHRALTQMFHSLALLEDTAVTHNDNLCVWSI